MELEIKKGDQLRVTQRNKGWDGETMEYKDEVDNVTVKKIIRRNGITRLHVLSQYGYGYTILQETFLSNGRGTIEKL